VYIFKSRQDGPLYLNEELTLEECLFDSEARVDEALSNVFSLCAVVLIRNGAPVRWRTYPSLSDYICVFKRMGEWQLSYDDDNDEFTMYFDSKLSLHQNIKEWQAVHGRLHISRAVYERISPANIQTVTARSSHMLTAFEIATDILNMTLSIQDL
jgi:hypothetical protein